MKYIHKFNESFTYDRDTLIDEIEGILVDIIENDDIEHEILLSSIEYCNIIINLRYIGMGRSISLSEINEPIHQLYDYMKYKFGKVRFMARDDYNSATIYPYNIDEYFRDGFVRNLKLVFSEK